MLFRSRVTNRRLILSASGFTLLTLVFASIFLSLETTVIEDSLIRVVFIGLAALTVPHMLLLAHVETPFKPTVA